MQSESSPNTRHPAFSSRSSSRTWDDPNSVDGKLWRKNCHQTMIGGLKCTDFHWKFLASFGFDLMSFLVFVFQSHGWQISWKHVSPACKHANFLEPRTTQNQSLHCHCRGPNMKLCRSPVSGKSMSQTRSSNQIFDPHMLTLTSADSWKHSEFILLVRWPWKSHSDIGFDQRPHVWCNCCLCTFWLKHFIKELTVSSVTWFT